MAVFEAVTLGWKGREYKVETDDQIMRLICEIENVVTLQELGDPGRVQLGKIATAYATALRFAGAYDVSSAAVYQDMFTSDKSAALIQGAISGLLAMMVPPSAYQPQGKPKAPAKSKPKKKPAASKARSG